MLISKSHTIHFLLNTLYLNKKSIILHKTIIMKLQNGKLHTVEIGIFFLEKMEDSSRLTLKPFLT